MSSLELTDYYGWHRAQRCQGFLLTMAMSSVPIALHARTVERSGLQILRGVIAARKYARRAKKKEEKGGLQN